MSHARLRVATFGGFRLIQRDGNTLRLRGKKVEATCAYLVLAGGAVRETLRALLWERATPRAGRHSVSQTLSQLHAQLGAVHERPLVTTNDLVSVAPNLITLDLHAVERLLGRNSAESLRVACRLCRGDFLAGMELGTPAFDAWLSAERVRACSIAFEAQWLYTMEAIARGNTVEALLSAFRLIELDPLNERGHLMLMTVYAGQGQVGAALGQYETCARQLEAARQIEPGEALKELRRQLLAAPAASLGFALDVASDLDRRRPR
jgi:DNA-binding SARP family transcriptional activator